LAFLLAAVIGILAGLGGLTRYALGWLIIPVLVFSSHSRGGTRAVLGLTALAAFAAVMGPWVRAIITSATRFLGLPGMRSMKDALFP